MKVRSIAKCAVFAAMLALCAWISIPLGALSITMQTFGVGLTLCLLGGKRGSVAIVVYLLLGMVGLPVFSGFRGGLGVLLGASGGYILGFGVFALVYWVLTALSDRFQVPALVFGMAACYGFGTVWFCTVYPPGGLGGAFVTCVLPFLLPDTLKLTLAVLLSRRLKGLV